MASPRGSLAPFFSLTFAITWGIAALLLLLPNQMASIFGPMSGRNPVFFLAVYAPTIAALVVTAAQEGAAGVRALLGRLVRWRFGVHWYAFVLLGVPALGLLAAASGGGVPEYRWAEWYLYLPLLVSQVFLDPGSLGEELGWRGYALPRLLRILRPLSASLVLGTIWFVWHLPAFFVAGTPQDALSLPAFFVSALSLSILATWLFQSSNGSVLPSLLLHLTANFSLNYLGAPMVQFSALLAVVAVGVVIATGATLGTRAGSPAKAGEKEFRGGASSTRTKGEQP